MIDTETTGEVMTHLTTGAVIVYAIQWLKGQGWMPWVTADSTTVNRVVSGVAAAAIAFGIGGHWDPVHGGVFTIPPLTELINGAWEFAKQYTVQQVVYDGVVQKAGVTKGGQA